MTRHFWTNVERDKLCELYPTHSTKECAAILGRTASGICGQVTALGLSKSLEWIAERSRAASLRSNHGGRTSQFKPGVAPWNKDKKGWSAPGTEKTRFRKGELAGRTKERLRAIGYETVRDGQLWRKVTNEFKNKDVRFNFRPVSVIVWEAAHGPVPKNHLVVFKPGMRTTNADEITLDRIELISRSENMRRNTVHNYPPAIVSAYALIGKATKLITQRESHGTHD